MKTIILITIAILISFDVMAYDMKCRKVKFGHYTDGLRCENNEVVCYIYNRGMSCEFKDESKEKSKIKNSNECKFLRLNNINGAFNEVDKSLINAICGI